MTLAYIGLGANLGDRAAMLHAALEQLAAEPDVKVVSVSSFRETDPVGIVEQPRFVNAAAAVETSLSARELLDRLLGIENRLGRTRDGPRFGPRTIDLDLLVYGDEQIAEPGLRVPHPRLHERLFALLLVEHAVAAEHLEALELENHRIVSLASLAGVGSRPAKPASADAWHRWRQDAPPSALGRTTCTVLRAAGGASFASGAPGTRGVT